MISIVTAYYNRIHHLRFTLNSILKTTDTNFEVVIVDDFSDTAHQLDSIPSEFPTINFKIIKMADIIGPTKTYYNPCVPFNVGFSYCSGDKIILQNPECCHIGDVIAYTRANLTDNNYLTFHCYATDSADTARLHLGDTIVPNATGHGKKKMSWWYNHIEHRSKGYHFTAAITRANLVKLNGFDERFANGYEYDDDELLVRIKNLKLPITFVAEPYVIHQYHDKLINPNNPPISVNNKSLFYSINESGHIRAEHNHYLNLK